MSRWTDRHWYSSETRVCSRCRVSPQDLQPLLWFDFPARCQRRCLILSLETCTQQFHRTRLRVTRRLLLGNTTPLVSRDRQAVLLHLGFTRALAGSFTPYPRPEPPAASFFWGKRNSWCWENPNPCCASPAAPWLVHHGAG